jgi:hypothetical protein
LKGKVLTSIFFCELTLLFVHSALGFLVEGEHYPGLRKYRQFGVDSFDSGIFRTGDSPENCTRFMVEEVLPSVKQNKLLESLQQRAKHVELQNEEFALCLLRYCDVSFVRNRIFLDNTVTTRRWRENF